MAHAIQNETDYQRLKWLADKNTWVDEFILMGRIGTVAIDAWDTACWIDTAFNPALRYRITEIGRDALAVYEATLIERRTVEIPYLSGDFYTTRHVELNWICPVCGGKRGDVYRTLSYDGSLRVNCDGWQNPCGHVDKYPDVLKEAQAAFEATPDTPASVDGFLFGKDVDVKRLQAHGLHEADGAPVEDKDARIRHLEAIIANHSASLLQEAHKSEQLQALLSEAAQVLAPLATYWRTTKDFNTGDIRLDAALKK